MDGRAHVLEANYTPSEAVDSLVMMAERLGAEWKDWFVAVQGGVNYSRNENTWTYTDPKVGNKSHLDLLSPQISLSIGHFFTPVLGWRLSAA